MVIGSHLNDTCKIDLETPYYALMTGSYTFNTSNLADDPTGRYNYDPIIEPKAKKSSDCDFFVMYFFSWLFTASGIFNDFLYSI